MKKQINFYNSVINHFIIDYLLLSNGSINKIPVFNKYYLTSTFYDVLERLLEQEGFYPKEALDRVDLIIEYVEKFTKEEGMDFSDDIENVKEHLKAAKEHPGYEVYNQNFKIKYSDFEELKQSEYIMWTKKGMDASIGFDYSVVNNFKSDALQYIERIAPLYVLNPLYLMSIKKIMNYYPKLLLDDDIKNRVLSILETNKAVNLSHQDVISKFCSKNKYPYDEEAYIKFIEENNSMLEQIKSINTRNYTNIFNNNYFLNQYRMSILENIIVLGKDFKIDYTDLTILEDLYSMIEFLDINDFCNATMKYNIVNLMDNFKNNSILDLKRYNHYLGMVNCLKLKENGYMSYIMSLKLSLKEQKDLSKEYHLSQDRNVLDEFMDTIQLDLEVLESFICSDQKYIEKYQNKFIETDDYLLSLERIYRNNSHFYNNKNIYERVMNILLEIKSRCINKELESKDFYKKTKKIIKKIDDIYYGKR